VKHLSEQFDDLWQKSVADLELRIAPV